MEINIKLPARAVDALENIAHELKELRLSLCPPLRGSTGAKPIDPKAPSQVQYPDLTHYDSNHSEFDWNEYWNKNLPIERREDRG